MNVLMIGAGDIAKSHGRAVVKLGGKVFAAYDVNEAGLKRYAEEFGCEMLTYEQIEENVPRADYNKIFPLIFVYSAIYVDVDPIM